MSLIGLGVYLPFAALPNRIINQVFGDLKNLGVDELNITNVFVITGRQDGGKAYRADINVWCDDSMQTMSFDLLDLTAAEQLTIDTLIKLRAAEVLKEL